MNRLHLRVWLSLMPALLAFGTADLIIGGAWIMELISPNLSIKVFLTAFLGIALWGVGLQSTPDEIPEEGPEITLLGLLTWLGMALFALFQLTRMAIVFDPTA